MHRQPIVFRFLEAISDATGHRGGSLSHAGHAVNQATAPAPAPAAAAAAHRLLLPLPLLGDLDFVQ